VFTGCSGSFSIQNIVRCCYNKWHHTGNRKANANNHNKAKQPTRTKRQNQNQSKSKSKSKSNQSINNQSINPIKQQTNVGALPSVYPTFCLLSHYLVALDDQLARRNHTANPGLLPKPD
jgi:hypothetical protein